MKAQKIIFLVGALFLLHSSTYSQIWYFGNNAGMDITGAEVGLAGGLINTTEGVGVQYDCNGDMLFYSDGINIWDDTHTAFAGGLLGGTSSMSQILICPKPTTSGVEYYVFYGIPGNAVVGVDLLYAVVDATTKTILVKDVSLSGTVFSENIGIVEHSNGTDYWLVTHQASAGGNNNFHTWIIDGTSGANGIAYGAASAVGQSMSFNSSNCGYMAVSKANDRIATAHAGNGWVQVFPFNNGAGTVGAPIRSWSHGAFSWVYGCAFSPDGNYLYYTRRQIFLRQGNIGSGATTDISTVAGNGGVWMGGVRRAGTDKIYVAMLNATDVGVLNTPNGWGAGAAGWDQTAIGGAGLLGNIMKDGLPTIPVEVFCPVVTGIELMSFTATENNAMVDLNWVSASEENNEYYAVERSKNGLDWEELGRVSGMGTTSQSTKYNFSDENPFLGTSYYRLKQTDFNGKSKSFNVEVVQFDQKAEVYMVNTNSEKVEFNVNIEKEDVAMVEIYNILGERVARQSMEFKKGSKIYEMSNLQNLTEGVFILQIKTANGLVENIKFKL